MLLDFWQHYLSPFLRSNFFIVVSTFAAGYIAWRIYQNQKEDAKRNAANVIMLEIEGAEEGLRKVTTQKPFNEDEPVVLLHNSSWDKYKHLFVQDFIGSRNEWNKISDFYAQCENYDKATRDYGTTRKDNQRELIANVQRVLAGYADQHAAQLEPSGSDFINEETRKKLEQQYIDKRQRFMNVIVGVVSQTAQINHYIPKQFEIEAVRALGLIDKNLSTNSAGIKLRNLATPKRSRLESLSWNIPYKSQN